MSRRRRRSSQEEVELNLAAMLDMAFQLLTFFILTFKPSPVEGQVTLRLPPPQAVTGGTADVGADTSKTDVPKGLNTLVISVFSNPAGDIAGIGVGQTPMKGIAELNGKLQAVFQDPGNPFDQVIIQVGQDLHYEQLMKVIEVCAAQKLPDGKNLSKLSFVELPNG